MRFRLILITCTAVFGLLWSSCGDEPPLPPIKDVSGKSRLFLVNEGNFQWGNASLSVYIPDSKELANNVFEAANGYPIGDVAQSISMYKGKLYVVVNNSGTVKILDSSNMDVIDEWTGFDSPRYVHHLKEDRALVTDLYRNAVYVVKRSTGDRIKEIPLKGWADKMKAIDQDIWVLNRGGSAVYRIDVDALEVRDSLVLLERPQQIEQDAMGNVWILCAGPLTGQDGALYKVDPNSFSVQDQHPLKITAFVHHLAVTPNGMEIYYNEKDLFKHTVTDTAFPEKPFFELNMQSPYGMCVDSLSGDIYVSDAKDYLSKSTVVRFSQSGEELHRFETGILTGDMQFVR